MVAVIALREDFDGAGLRRLARVGEEFGISLDESTMGRELKALGFRKIWRLPVILRQTNGR
jgi:hypothetical protein